MGLTKEHQELIQVGETLDYGVSSLPDSVWETTLNRYHELMRIVKEQQKIGTYSCLLCGTTTTLPHICPVFTSAD